MGKSRGGKHGFKGRERTQRIGPHGEGAEEVEEADSDEEQAPQQQRRGLGACVCVCAWRCMNSVPV